MKSRFYRTLEIDGDMGQYMYKMRESQTKLTGDLQRCLNNRNHVI